MKQNQYLFYNENEQAYNSANIIYQEIKKYLPKVNSLIDFGCGMAAFAKVFQEGGANDITIVDHPALDTTNCLIKEDYKFVPCNLDTELPKHLKADVLICTEVLEHINTKRATKVLQFISECSDIIIFSAAVPGQDGLGHINLQRHEYWINEFGKRGFNYCDKFKADIIKNEKVYYWLRQNLFIFYKNQPQHSPLQNSVWIPKDFEVLNANILNRKYGLKEWLKLLPEAINNSITFRFNKHK